MMSFNSDIETDKKILFNNLQILYPLLEILD